MQSEELKGGPGRPKGAKNKVAPKHEYIVTSIRIRKDVWDELERQKQGKEGRADVIARLAGFVD